MMHTLSADCVAERFLVYFCHSVRQCCQSVVSAKDVRNQMVPVCTEWWCDTDNQATKPFDSCPSMAFFSVRPQTKQMPRRSYLLASSWRTGGDLQDAIILRGWRLSSKTWSPI